MALKTGSDRSVRLVQSPASLNSSIVGRFNWSNCRLITVPIWLCDLNCPRVGLASNHWNWWSDQWIGWFPMTRTVHRFFLFFKNFFPSKWRFSLYVSSPNLAPFPPCMSPTTPCRSNWRLQSHCLCTSTRNPLDFKSSMWILQFIYFFLF